MLNKYQTADERYNDYAGKIVRQNIIDFVEDERICKKKETISHRTMTSSNRL